MKTMDQIHKANLQILINEAGNSTALAEKTGKSNAQISQWLNGSKDSKTGKPRGMRDTTCRFLEDKCGKQEGWMDKDHSSDKTEHLKAKNAEAAAKSTTPALSENDTLSTILGLKGKVTSRSERVLLKLEKKCLDGIVSDEDMENLERLVDRFGNP
jgi:hypothetical protein